MNLFLGLYKPYEHRTYEIVRQAAAGSVSVAVRGLHLWEMPNDFQLHHHHRFLKRGSGVAASAAADDSSKFNYQEWFDPADLRGSVRPETTGQNFIVKDPILWSRFYDPDELTTFSKMHSFHMMSTYRLGKDAQSEDSPFVSRTPGSTDAVVADEAQSVDAYNARASTATWVSFGNGAPNNHGKRKKRPSIVNIAELCLDPQISRQEIQEYSRYVGEGVRSGMTGDCDLFQSQDDAVNRRHPDHAFYLACSDDRTRLVSEKDKMLYEAYLKKGEETNFTKVR